MSNGRFALERNFEYIELSSEEVSGSSLDPFGLSVDVLQYYEFMCKYAFQLLGNVCPRHISEHVDKHACSVFM